MYVLANRKVLKNGVINPMRISRNICVQNLVSIDSAVSKFGIIQILIIHNFDENKNLIYLFPLCNETVSFSIASS